MPLSMTGFGKAVGEVDGQPVAVELSSVNHRYLDTSVRLPFAWAGLEPEIKQLVRNRISRGKLNITISTKRGHQQGLAVKLDPEVARQYIEASKELSHMISSFETLSIDVLAQLPGVFYSDEPEADLERLQIALSAVIEEAIAQLQKMRANEGRGLAKDIRDRIENMRTALARVESRLPELNASYEKRLRTRIEELRLAADIAEERIAFEVAILAEKGDVTEEVVRLKTHLDHVIELLEIDEPVGRRLDFLSQEIQREINTLGVKTRDADVAKDVLSLKAELEKFREQVQNIE